MKTYQEVYISEAQYHLSKAISILQDSKPKSLYLKREVAKSIHHISGSSALLIEVLQTLEKDNNKGE